MTKIKLNNLSVEYPLHSLVDRSIKLKLMNLIKGESLPTVEGNFHIALNSIDLNIEAGDRVCLIGHNGSGKTTLLKTIAGILPVSSGYLEVNGKISALLDFATGFEMEMTGYDNIYIRLLLLGVSKSEIPSKREEIIQFSELGEFIYQPVKTYSAGMFIRLAFSIVTSIDPDILLVDEIVGAGDATFAAKAQERMLKMLDRGNTVVMATHSTELAIELCNKAVWLNHGIIAGVGRVSDVIEEYLEHSAKVRESKGK